MSRQAADCTGAIGALTFTLAAYDSESGEPEAMVLQMSQVGEGRGRGAY